LRKMWKCGDAELVVGYVGRIHPQKNCIALALALSCMGTETTGVVYGSRCVGANEVESSMRQLAGDRIRLFPPVEDIGSVLAAIDVFFLPSPEEVFSLSLLEAWAAGTPVVATRVGAVLDLEAEVGPLVVPIQPNASAHDLAAAIRYAALNGPDVVSMCHRAAELVRTRFGVLKMASSWTQYLVDCGRNS